MPRNYDSKISANEYQLSYRNVKYPRLEFKTGSLLIVLPKGYKTSGELLEKYDRWITAKREEIEKAVKMAKKLKLRRDRSRENFRKVVDSAIEKDQRLLGVHINRVFYRKMNSKWGSLSSKGNLTLNPILEWLPDSSVRYVIFHEIAHSISRKHDKPFWSTVNSVFPNHKTIEKELFAYWFLVQETIESVDKTHIQEAK
jgi:predicted metal-dependent hydrolase